MNTSLQVVLVSGDLAVVRRVVPLVKMHEQRVR
jgi:hypothetical protein